MVYIRNDDTTYIKSYVRGKNNTNAGPFELKYAKVNLQTPIKTSKNTKYITSSLDIDNKDTKYLIPNVKCDKVSKQFCSEIEKIIKDIEVDIRKKIVFYNPINFDINFSELEDKFESESHLASTLIEAYYLLNFENSTQKLSYPQALVKQLVGNNKIQFTSDSDFTITLSNNESSYITNPNELRTKNDGYDLRLILYHEIIHGLGIKSEGMSYPKYLESSYVDIVPSEYTSFTGDKSYLIMFIEPSVYDSYIYNNGVSDYSLAKEMLPMVEKFPEITEKIGKDQKQNLYSFTEIIKEVVETNSTILNGSHNAYDMVTNEGLYFKGKTYEVPLHVVPHDFENGVSISHTKHYDNEVKGDKVLLDWRIPKGILLTETSPSSATPNNGVADIGAEIMGPEIMDMLNTIGWPTIDSNNGQYDNYTVENSKNIFSLVHDSSSAKSIPLFPLFNICIILILFLWH